LMVFHIFLFVSIDEFMIFCTGPKSILVNFLL
jgi:hypothetical protein